MSESQRCGDGRHKDTIWAPEGELFTLEWGDRGSNNNSKSEQSAAYAAVHPEEIHTSVQSLEMNG